MKPIKVTLDRSITKSACTGAFLLIAAGASAQNLFLADYSNGNIYEITPGGTSSVFATGMNYPDGITFNSADDLFVANTGNNGGGGSIAEITPDGKQTTFASNVDPHGLAFNSAGNLFAADYNSGNIYEFTPAGVQSTFASGLNLPLSLAINAAGDLFVGDSGGDITKITPTGTQSLFASGLNNPHGLAFNSAGNLFETDGGTGNVYEFTPAGVRSTYGSVTAANGLAFDGANLFVDSANGPIVEILPNGTENTITTEPGLPAMMALQPVPEPSVLGLLGAGAAALMIRRRAGKQTAGRV
ncbi:MAG TPA: PEP-CTERM sorting domain-containing protein [Candidatus Acidoferrales bacterium]|jgi:sugar lactone lactonase YvrE|nr:PEP-CTERM sorting domain-containing protein [Candidatus Acidoferrales bacterium]